MKKGIPVERKEEVQKHSSGQWEKKRRTPQATQWWRCVQHEGLVEGESTEVSWNAGMETQTQKHLILESSIFCLIITYSLHVIYLIIFNLRKKYINLLILTGLYIARLQPQKNKSVLARIFIVNILKYFPMKMHIIEN